jgi:hypothetical protein
MGKNPVIFVRRISRRRTMSSKRLVIAVLVLVCTFRGHANAQKNEVAGIIGRTFISDQVIPTSTSADNLLRYGNGLTFEGNISRQVMGGQALTLSLEVPVVFNVDEDVHSHSNPVAPGFSSLFVTPAARLNIFSNTAVSPWVSVGGGFGHFNGSAVQFQPKTSSTSGIFQIGGGLDVALFRHFTLRGELRDFWSGTPDLHITTNQSRQHNLFVGAGLVWHFGK